MPKRKREPRSPRTAARVASWVTPGIFSVGSGTMPARPAANQTTSADERSVATHVGPGTRSPARPAMKPRIAYVSVLPECHATVWDARPPQARAKEPHIPMQ